MGVDVSKIASSALEAALDDGQPRRKRGSTVKAVAAGAALAVAARAAASKAPRVNPLRLMPLPSLDGLRDIPDRVRDRLADAGWLDDEVDVEEAELDEEPLDEEEEDEPEAEDEDEEPVDEAEEDEDEDEEDDEDELDEEDE